VPIVTESRSMTDLPGVGAYIRALGYEGSSKADMVPGHIRIGIVGRTPTLAVSALLLRTHANMGMTYDPTFVRSFQIARWGDGLIFLNADTGVTLYANDLAPEFLAKGGGPVTVTEMGTDTFFLS
jgi:hypothetical protein